MSAGRLIAQPALVRGTLLILAFVAALASLAVGRYFALLCFAPIAAPDAFLLVRTLNPVLFATVLAAWIPLCGWLAATYGATARWQRALLPGPFGGEPASMLTRELGVRRSGVARHCSRFAAFAWPFGLVLSHLAHPLALLVGVAWLALAVTALILRFAVR